LTDYVRFLRAGIPTLAESMRDNGFTTAAFVNSHDLSSRYGLDRGFDHHKYVEEFVEQREASDVGRRAIRWLSRNGSHRFFLFLHFYDVHSDYRSLPRFEKLLVRSSSSQVDGTTQQLLRIRAKMESVSGRDVGRLIDLYDAGIRQFDETLRKLQSALEAEGLAERTVVVITSDHGEEFLEHGGVLHGRTQYEELIRVPLVMFGPGIPKGKKIYSAVSLIDIAPTLLALVGVDPNPIHAGMDLSPLWNKDSPEPSSRLLYAEADHGNAQNNVKHSVRQGHFKVHHDSLAQRWTLHELTLDPGERLDVSSEHLEVTKRLRAELEAFMKNHWVGETIDPLSLEEEAKLKSLGYLE
jgi:arylsulfatase A-like enzyme